MSKDKERDYSQEKMRRIAVGATVAGVLLGVFLVIVLIIQFVQMGVNRRELKSLEKSIGEYKHTIEKNERVLDDYVKGDGLYYLALKQGWKSK